MKTKEQRDLDNFLEIEPELSEAFKTLRDIYERITFDTSRLPIRFSFSQHNLERVGNDLKMRASCHHHNRRDLSDEYWGCRDCGLIKREE